MTVDTSSLSQAFAEIRANPLHDEAARRMQYLQAAKQYRQETLEALKQRHYNGAPGTAIVEAHTSSVDTLLMALYDLALSERYAENGTERLPCALVALGGYGRGSLFPHSDLDVMLLHEGRLTARIEDVNSFFLYFLWDVGFKVGHSVRSISEAMRFAQLDDTAKTAMLESRLIAGNPQTFVKYHDSILSQVRQKGVEKFIAAKQKEREKVYREIGSDVYCREPHIKQSPGGLRDYHAAVWIAIAKFGLRTPRELWQAHIITEEEYLHVDLALDFLHRIRTHLHFEAGMQDDILTLDRQEEMARAFAYEGESLADAVRLFMQDYYQNAVQLHHFYLHMLSLGRKSSSRLRALMTQLTAEPLDRGLRLADKRVLLPEGEETWFREDPSRLMEVVWYAQKYGFELSDRAAARIRLNADLIDDEFQQSPVMRDHFLAMLSSPDRAGPAFRQLDSLGLLDRYIPEFADVREIVRYGGFHQYPVGEHTLRAIENLRDVGRMEDKSSPSLKAALDSIARPDLLAVGILMHDIGKVDEADHVTAGIEIATRFCNRLGLKQEETDIVLFLIRQHLIMSKLSQYRDTDDPKIVRDFAEQIGSVERLNLLYVLTFCDIKAVREGAWTEWKGALLANLYQGAKAILQGSDQAETNGHDFEVKSQAVASLVANDKQKALAAHLAGMRPTYLRAFTPEDIAEHLNLIARLEKRDPGFAFTDEPQYGSSVITVVTRDRPQLFSRIVGALASLSVNVIEAGIHTRDDGTVIDVFRVTGAGEAGPIGEDMWETVRKRLRQVLQDERDVSDLLATAPRRGQRHTALAAARLNISFDNHVSDTHTVIDVEAPDRVGLLFDLASTLAELKLDLAVAKIATDVRQARDVFYVSAQDGAKLQSADTLETVRDALELAAADPATERTS